MNKSDMQPFNPTKLSVFSAFAYYVADCIIYPIDTLATRIKANQKEHLTIRQEYNKVMRTSGIKTLYKGFTSTFYCSFSPMFVYFWMYEHLSKQGNQLYKKKDTESKFNKYMRYSLPFFVSGIAEIACLLLYLPFDIVRTRMQVNHPQYQYKGMWQGINDIVKNEGLFRLFKASHLYITVMTLQTSIQFQTYELMRKSLLSHQSAESQKHLDIQNSLMVSIASSAIATFMVNPLDLVVTRFQILDSSKHHVSATRVIKYVYKNEGFKGFVKGLEARLFHCCGYSLIFLPVYDYFKGEYGYKIDF